MRENFNNKNLWKMYDILIIVYFKHNSIVVIINTQSSPYATSLICSIKKQKTRNPVKFQQIAWQTTNGENKTRARPQ